MGLIALGEAVARRADEVAASVVADWLARGSPSPLGEEVIRGLIGSTCRLGTQLIGRFLATGQAASSAEKRELAGHAGLSAFDRFSLLDHAKNYLAWRDATLQVLFAEGTTLGVELSTLRRAAAVVRRSCDTSLLAMVGEFDRRRTELQETLDAERAKLALLALRDPLTGLANRTVLVDRLQRALSGRRDGQEVVVLFLDLDGFKAVNDRHGHDAGDQLLIAVANCLTSLVRPTDTVARLGGDEFVILCEQLPGGMTALRAFTQRIGDAVEHRSLSDGFRVTVSIGVATSTADCNGRDMLARADAAMYAVKHRRTA